MNPGPRFAERGSQRWLQVCVRRRPELLERALAGSLRESIRWQSPQPPAFKEYRDAAALRLAGIAAPLRRPLQSSWPRRGPVWDAIGITSSNAPVFLEAKANLPEAASPGSKARGASLKMIRRAVAEAQRFYCGSTTRDWTGTYFQYANRLAHHYFLRQLNRVPSHLVFVYFLNAVDVAGPETVAQWRAAIARIHDALGLPGDLRKHDVHEAFVDVAGLVNVAR